MLQVSSDSWWFPCSFEKEWPTAEAIKHQTKGSNNRRNAAKGRLGVWIIRCVEL